MEPTPCPSAAFDLNQALLQSREQARAQWAEALASFQAQMGSIAALSLPAVVQAAGPAFGLGFSFSAQTLIHDERPLLRVTLRHRSGAEEFSEALAPEEGSPAWHLLTASLLAGLLGIPVDPLAQTIEPEMSNSALFVKRPGGAADPGPGGDPVGQAADAAAEPGADDEWTAADAGQQVPVDPALVPLSQEEIDTLHRFLAAMAPDARKRFTIEFRHHFAVPKEARTIKDRITQRRHKDFIDAFERELAGGQR
jgi:hypothetical protein